MKRMTKTIPPAHLIAMKPAGGYYNALIFAVDKERRDIVLWLLEIGANVNEWVKNDNPL